MPGYVRIYSPDGEMFEVGEERASDLLLNCGWSRNPHEVSVSMPDVTDGQSEEVRDAAEETVVKRRRGRD